MCNSAACGALDLGDEIRQSMCIFTALSTLDLGDEIRQSMFNSTALSALELGGGITQSMCNSTALRGLGLGGEITQSMCNFRGFGQLLAISLRSMQLDCASGAGRSGGACSDNSGAMDLDANLSGCVTPNPGCAPGPHSLSRLARVRDSLSA